MTNTTIKLKRIGVLAPLLGTVLFILLYIVASHYYPGGSQVEKHSIGFSWINNYWCNLLDANAINGHPNPAQPIAIGGMIILEFTLVFFWLLCAKFMNISRAQRLVLKISGLLCVVSALFLTSMNHDLIINLSALFGLIATLIVLIGIYREKQMKIFVVGLITILLVGVNNYLYYHQDLIVYLPLVQKITFAIFLFWICSIDLYLFRKSKSRDNSSNL